MADNKGYMSIADEHGTIHISEDVIASIAVSAVTEVEGVSGMMSGLGTMTELTGKKSTAKAAKSVKLEANGELLTLDLYITVEYGHAIPEVAENAQAAVISAVEATTGCHVDTVNIHVSGVTMN